MSRKERRDEADRKMKNLKYSNKKPQTEMGEKSPLVYGKYKQFMQNFILNPEKKRPS
jgi:hypothetical protein